MLTDNDETVVPSYEGACAKDNLLFKKIYGFTTLWSDPSDDATTGSILNNDLDLQLYMELRYRNESIQASSVTIEQTTWRKSFGVIQKLGKILCSSTLARSF